MKKKRKIIITSFVAAIIIFCIIGRILLKEKTLTERAALISELSVPDNVKVVKHDEFWWISNGYLYLEIQLEKEQLNKIVDEAKTKKEYLLGDKIENLNWYLSGKYVLPKDLSKVYYWYEKSKSSDPLRYTIVLIDMVSGKLIVYVSDS
ncbi:MAG: hypothetical protein A2452_04405 [Candidatus Firestonebacteria bacterium RIFOXYC2_FULL_39_67]|nr:MAG: hypothetical protein A2536_04120 [Candidatus Firestonebacteria bacterium RIFOXYD2_FULL_39_29]OGF56832.1 MAG: hypothetical protein A2452_04405 [Candidatus Firestonebacteria bacterium RIFOXYC2_FULL_39_67]